MLPCPHISVICKLPNSYSNMKGFGDVISVIAILAKQKLVSSSEHLSGSEPLFSMTWTYNIANFKCSGISGIENVIKLVNWSSALLCLGFGRFDTSICSKFLW